MWCSTVADAILVGCTSTLPVFCPTIKKSQFRCAVATLFGALENPSLPYPLFSVFLTSVQSHENRKSKSWMVGCVVGLMISGLAIERTGYTRILTDSVLGQNTLDLAKFLSLTFVACTLCTNVLLTALIGQSVSCVSLSSILSSARCLASRVWWIGRIPCIEDQQSAIDSPTPVSDKQLRRLVAIV